MADLTLSREELVNLTGRKRPTLMAEWLIARGWVFEPALRRGEFPKVDRAYYLARTSGQTPSPRRTGPRLDFLLAPQ